jgi:F-type H+-transporting ATPase subunit b
VRRIKLLLAVALLVGGSVFALSGVAVAQEDEGPNLTHETEECIELLEDGGEPDDCNEAPSPILPATNEIVWGSISFVVLLFLLSKFAYPAIKQSMEGRAERIRNSLDEAERTRAEAQSILDDYQRQLADAKNEAARIIEEARQAADAMRRDLMAKAEAEAQGVRERAQADITTQVERATADLRSQVAALSVEAAEMVVKNALTDRETQLRLVEDYITQVGARS